MTSQRQTDRLMGIVMYVVSSNYLFIDTIDIKQTEWLEIQLVSHRGRGGEGRGHTIAPAKRTLKEAPRVSVIQQMHCI